MKTTTTRYLWRSLLLAGVALWFAAPSALAAGRWATLEAIHHLENPRNLTRPGPFGELGAYQFRSSTWKMHTKVPFARANNRAESDLVAIAHYDYLKRGLERNGVPATPYTIALAWNAGLDSAVNGKSPRVAHEYARRAVNLAEELQTRVPTMGPKAAAALADSGALDEPDTPATAAASAAVASKFIAPTVLTTEPLLTVSMAASANPATTTTPAVPATSGTPEAQAVPVVTLEEAERAMEHEAAIVFPETMTTNRNVAVLAKPAQWQLSFQF